MNEQQTERLHLLVQSAKGRGGQLPTAGEFVEMLPEPITERAASSAIQRLAAAQECFVKEKNRWYTNPLLCTEPESARYLLLFAESCRNDRENRVSPDAFHEILQSEYGCTLEILDALLTMSIKGKYLEGVPLFPSYFRCGQRLIDQRFYLERLAGEHVVVNESRRSVEPIGGRL